MDCHMWELLMNQKEAVDIAHARPSEATSRGGWHILVRRAYLFRFFLLSGGLRRRGGFGSDAHAKASSGAAQTRRWFPSAEVVHAGNGAVPRRVETVEGAYSRRRCLVEWGAEETQNLVYSRGRPLLYARRVCDGADLEGIDFVSEVAGMRHASYKLYEVLPRVVSPMPMRCSGWRLTVENTTEVVRSGADLDVHALERRYRGRRVSADRNAGTDYGVR
ncbi:hypothetical protein R3P38DRAFT_1325088 [Favolaschia claudopus]|uniref:Uncharacterized protein n=1 Tax=Favolaschia claudopus TaxID=2862362 RepID=A0AAW0AXV5_9AGAR